MSLCSESKFFSEVSPSPPIFDLAVKVLLLLVTFKEHMIGEIGIVVEKTFLCILESGNSLFEHKKQAKTTENDCKNKNTSQ